MKSKSNLRGTCKKRERREREAIREGHVDTDSERR